VSGLPRQLLALCALATLIASAHAEPWLLPGDEGVRSDIQLLADAGVLHGPVTTWPVSWPDIARDVLGAHAHDLDGAAADALMRIQRMARAASSTGFAGAGIRVRGARDRGALRSFADTPREEAELALRASWMSEHLSLDLQGAVVADPADGKKFRADGSYLGVNIGNFVISAGFIERWWGPGWDGSLILSTNARPIPSLTLERNYTDPFKSRLLSWIGPWRASIAVGEAESHDVAVPKIRFLAARVNVKPRPWIEIGVSRTAQWCGGNRECSWSTFTNMLAGRDNQIDSAGGSIDQPGNQMAGYDMRLRSPWRKLPLAFYTQWIGEDEAGGFPSKFVGLFGIEGWGSTPLGGLRVRAEYADTACNFSRQSPEFGCTYRNSIYPDGYTYRGRIIGHTIDNDSRMYSLGTLLTRANGDVVSLAVRRVELNRDGGPHAISAVRRDVDNVELRYLHEFEFGRVSIGVAYDDPAPVAESGADLRGYVSWQRGI
jgi:hypothetical protein